MTKFPWSKVMAGCWFKAKMPWGFLDPDTYAGWFEQFLGWAFGVGTSIAPNWWDPDDGVGNIAIPGFPQNVNWEVRGY